MTNDAQQGRHPSVREVIEGYLSRRRGGRLLVVSDAVRDLRADIPATVLTDRELSDEVASLAIGEGFDIHFDRPR